MRSPLTGGLDPVYVVDRVSLCLCYLLADCLQKPFESWCQVIQQGKCFLSRASLPGGFWVGRFVLNSIFPTLAAPPPPPVPLLAQPQPGIWSLSVPSSFRLRVSGSCPFGSARCLPVTFLVACLLPSPAPSPERLSLTTALTPHVFPSQNPPLSVYQSHQPLCPAGSLREVRTLSARLQHQQGPVLGNCRQRSVSCQPREASPQSYLLRSDD